jgi:TonB family protein
MELRSLACRLCLCAALLAPGEVLARARDQTSAEVRDWISAVVTKIDKADRERADRSRSKASGTVTIRVQVAADGFVNRVEVERSSGSSDLDERARSAARAASPFSPPPASLLTRAGTTELSFPLRLGR